VLWEREVALLQILEKPRLAKECLRDRFAAGSAHWKEGAPKVIVAPGGPPVRRSVRARKKIRSREGRGQDKRTTLGDPWKKKKLSPGEIRCREKKRLKNLTLWQSATEIVALGVNLPLPPTEKKGSPEQGGGPEKCKENRLPTAPRVKTVRNRGVRDPVTGSVKGISKGWKKLFRGRGREIQRGGCAEKNAFGGPKGCEKSKKKGGGGLPLGTKCPFHKEGGHRDWGKNEK